MSQLIEDSLFQPQFFRAKTVNLVQNAQSYRKDAHPKKQHHPTSNRDNLFYSKMEPTYIIDRDTYLHKYQNFSLVLMRRRLAQKYCRFQGLILFGDHKFSIQYKQKRILFGKQWMKSRQQHPIKLSVNFSTGQLKLIWPETFSLCSYSILGSKIPFQRLFNHINQEFIHFFRNQLMPVFKKIYLFEEYNENQWTEDFQQSSEEILQKSYDQNNVRKIEKYLFMSTTIDSFVGDKQAFGRMHDKAIKQKQTILKVQSNIDISFSNLSTELNLFTKHTIKRATKQLLNFGHISYEQHRVLKQCLANEVSRNKQESQCQFILNCIGIIKIDSKRRFISSGGTCHVFLIKMIFQYIFSEDPQYWIQQNKKLQNNIQEKTFVIKEAKKGSEQKLRHESQIVKQMKGGFSIYLPKYYRVQNVSTQTERFRNEDLLIIDYLRGQSLDAYTTSTKEILSFWTKVFLMRNILNGLRFIRGYKIVHLDLKPANIIITPELLTKIIDFSESYHPKICKQNYMPGITLPYSCPQLLNKRPINYDQKCDIFSLGVVMFELFLGRGLFQQRKQKIHQYYEQKSYLKNVFLSPQQFEGEQLGPLFLIILQLMMRCLDPRPQYRPTMNWVSIIFSRILTYFRGR